LELLGVYSDGFSNETGAVSLVVGYGFIFVRADAPFGLRGVSGFHWLLVLQFAKGKILQKDECERMVRGRNSQFILRTLHR
jgi:hypothetical protein